MSNNTAINEIERLAQICRKDETNLLIGKYELSVNQSLIHFVVSEYKSSSNRNSLTIKVNYLKQLFRKIPSLKIVGDKSSPDLVLHVSPFASVVSLKLIRVPFKSLVGLETIRAQLKSLDCFKCFNTQVLDEEFFNLFGVWPQLTSLTLRQNNITSVKPSIIPSSVQSLDLSWNRIKVFNNIANYSVNYISKLDLSYNCLTEVPKLNDISCSSLKSLYIRGNLIESVEGIEKFDKIVEFDIGVNCIVDISALISSLRRCKTLKCLWIDGNPFACDPNSTETIQKQINFLTKLNDCIITRENTSSDDSQENSSTKVFKNNSDEESDNFFDASCDSMDSSKNNDTKIDGKKKKRRVVDIKDQIQVEHSLEKLDLKSSEVNDKNNRNSNEAQELIQKRKELGDEWLVSMRLSLENNSYLDEMFRNSSPITPINESSNFTTSSPIKAELVSSDRKISTISSNTTDDEIEILIEEKNEWSAKELENETNIIIVENADNNQTIFIYVREEDGMIFEKDCISGKVLRTHDLKVLTNVEIINDLVLKICFDSLVYAKREVKYRFDSIETCHQFNDKFIIPWIAQRKQQKIAEEVLYECLKCGQTKSSASQVICCGVCGSDAIMKTDSQRKRRSGSDITILSQIHSQNPSELKNNSLDEINVWEELFSVNSFYDNSYFTRVEHSLKLYIEVKLFSDDEEVIEGMVKCKAMTNKQSRMQSAFLVFSNKNILVLTIDENQSYDNLDAYLKLELSKPISSLIRFKDFPHLLIDEGFGLEFRGDNQSVAKSRSKSLLTRFGSKRSQFSETLYCLVLFYDKMIGKSFINYFTATINRLGPIPRVQCKGQALRLTENAVDIHDEVIVTNVIKCAHYKRNDMKNELILSEQMVAVVTEQSVILGELFCDFANDFNIKVLYKELIINLMPQIYVNLQNKSFRLSFSDNIETNFVINCYTNDSIKSLLVPIKSLWEKAFDVSMPLYKF